jgi:hypothetical protein
VLKSKSNYVIKFFSGKHSREIRNDAHWTKAYPSTELSWLRKTFNAAGDWVFNYIDYFFRGSINRDFNGDLPNPDKFHSTCIEWELNQDIADIVLNDIKISFNWILPAFVRKYTFRLHQLALLYLFTDVVYDNESRELPDFQHKEVIHTDSVKKIVISSLQVIKERFDSKCLFINDWLKNLYMRFKMFLRLEKDNKTYYLLGYFAPQTYNGPYDEKNYMIRGPDKAKIYPAFSFHIRN